MKDVVEMLRYCVDNKYDCIKSRGAWSRRKGKAS